MNALNDTPGKQAKIGQVFSLQIRVFYEDTDFGGIVYYANYLKFMERARTEMLRSFGVNQSKLLTQDRRMFVVKSADIEFISPARFDDLLCVTAEVKKVRRASMHFNQQCKIVESASAQTASAQTASAKSNERADSVAGGDLVATANVVIACLDADSFKPSAMPGHLNTVLNH